MTKVINFFITSCVVFLLERVASKCLPSSLTPKVCSLCDFSSYTSGVVSNQTNSSTKLCEDDKLTLKRKRQVFVDSSITNGTCENKSASCDGSIHKPYQNLTWALEFESHITRIYLSSEIEYLLLSQNHSLMASSNLLDLRRIELFRRSFVNITIRPAYCEEYNVTNCLKIEEKPRVKAPPQAIFIYVAHKLLIKNINFEGPSLCSSSPPVGSPSNDSFCINRSLLNSSKP
jgi:hypothetical protein